MKNKNISDSFSFKALENYSRSSSYFHQLYLEIIELSHSDKQARDKVDRALYGLVEGIYQALGKIVEMKADFSVSHYQKVADYSLSMAQSLGLDIKSQNVAYFAGLLHDIGKNHIPDEILYKPGKLTDSEWQVMSLHSEISWELLKKISILEDEAMIARNHHIKGYKGHGRIGDLSKILIMADAYDAMTNERVYRDPGRSAMSAEQARQEIARCLDNQFDQRLYQEAFLKWYQEGLPEPDRSVISITNRHPEIFDNFKTVADQLNLFDEIEEQFVDLLKQLVEKSDINKRGYNPFVPAIYAYHVALEYGLNRILANNVFRAALLGGLGQMFIRDQLSVKDGNKLADIIELRRFALNKGTEIFDLIPSFQELSKIIRFIYESWDGKSSVFGKKAKDIPVESRAVRTGVAFYFYQGDLDQLSEMSGKQLDPAMVIALKEYLSKEKGSRIIRP